jgi:NAD+ synthase (glutamine-hydrolysing)
MISIGRAAARSLAGRPAHVIISGPPVRRREYDLPTIKHWLGVLPGRFVQTSQFKRSTMPNAPKVGSGGSLSPRGDWRAPSDANARA